MPPKKNTKLLKKKISDDEYSDSAISSESGSDDIVEDNENNEDNDIDENENLDDDNLDDDKNDPDDENNESNNEDDDNQDNEDDDKDDVDNDKQKHDGDDVESVNDDDCLYKFTGNNAIFDDEDEEIYFSEDEDNNGTNDEFVNKEERITKPVLTKYEKVRLLGVRARELSLGAKPMIKGFKNTDPKSIARKELELKVIPLKIIRQLPTGKKERWYLKELEIID